MPTFDANYGSVPTTLKEAQDQSAQRRAVLQGKNVRQTGFGTWASDPANPQPVAGALGASAGGIGSGSGGAGGLDLTGSQAVQSIQQAAGGLPEPPAEVGSGVPTLSGQPGQMRPGLATSKALPADGGLRSLQRKVY